MQRITIALTENVLRPCLTRQWIRSRSSDDSERAVSMEWIKPLLDGLKKAGEYLETPSKVVGFGSAAYIFLGFVLQSILGVWPVHLLYLILVGCALVGLAIGVFGLRQWPAKRRWIALLVFIITGVFSFGMYSLMPPKAKWDRVNVEDLARQRKQLPPPLNIIGPILWATEGYPGGTTFRERVQEWRVGDGYQQFVVFASTKITPNRVPQSVALKDPALAASIGVYVFSDWDIKERLGVETEKCTHVDIASNGLGPECFVVVFVFPFSKEAANRLQESPDEILVL
jgi:hypothetical protein